MTPPAFDLTRRRQLEAPGFQCGGEGVVAVHPLEQVTRRLSDVRRQLVAETLPFRINAHVTALVAQQVQEGSGEWRTVRCATRAAALSSQNRSPSSDAHPRTRSTPF